MKIGKCALLLFLEDSKSIMLLSTDYIMLLFAEDNKMHFVVIY